MEHFVKKAALTITSIFLLAPVYAAAATAEHPTHKPHTTLHTAAHTAAASHAQHASRHSTHSASSKPGTPHTQYATIKSTTKKPHTHHPHAKSKKMKSNKGIHHTVAVNNTEKDDVYQTAFDNNDSSTYKQKSAFSFGTNEELVNLADRTVQNLHRTSYKLGGNDFDPYHGVYRLDCSSYVNNLLQKANPNAYSTLAEWSRTYKPTSSDYYAFFNQLPSNNWRYWHKINKVDQLGAGDILVFRYGSVKRRSAGGHVMVVMNKPQNDPMSPNVFWVSVADSAASGHSDDTRPAHTSGVGIGKLLLKIDPHTKRVAAYAWKAGANWKPNTQIVMASPDNKNNVS